MTIDLDLLLALQIPNKVQIYDWSQCALYSLGIGFGMNPLDSNEVKYVFENGLEVFPTMVNVLADPGFWIRDLAPEINWVQVVHGEQSVRFYQPLRVHDEVVGISRIIHVMDKGPGRGAVLYVERKIKRRETGEEIANILQTIFCRGDGGFGGAAHAYFDIPTLNGANSRLIARYETSPQAALIYRLLADLNPLHIDPLVAREAGYERPILHGLVTHGLAGRAVIDTCCGGISSLITRLDVRMSSPVFPGDVIVFEVSRHTTQKAYFTAYVESDNRQVVSKGYAEFKS